MKRTGVVDILWGLAGIILAMCLMAAGKS